MTADLFHDHDRREPFYLQWHITDRCNLGCRHCYRAGARSDPGREDLQRVFRQFKELRTSLPHSRIRVQIAGGEPFLSPHLHELMDWVACEGYQIRILSNGTVITPGVARMVESSGCATVQISLEGGRTGQESIRGAGTFDRALAAASLLRERGVAVTFAMTLTRQTVAELDEFLELAARHADRVGFHRLVPCGRGEDLSADVLSPQELKNVFARIWTARDRGGPLQFSLRDPLWKAFLGGPIRPDSVGGCSLGRGGICIEADGTVYPCRRLPVAAGNALTGNLREIWCGPLLAGLRDRGNLKGRCSACVYLHACGGCRAIAHALTGDALAADPQCFRRPGLLERPLRQIALAASRGVHRAETGYPFRCVWAASMAALRFSQGVSEGTVQSAASMKRSGA